MNASDRIAACLALRKRSAEFIANFFRTRQMPSETEFCEAFHSGFMGKDEVLPSGWYAPPPYGTSALFSDEGSYERLLFDSLRKPECWPSDHCPFLPGSLGLVYASPVHSSGSIGDFGVTVYRGLDPKIRNHMARCLLALERIAEYAQPGMECRELYQFSFEEAQRHNLGKSSWQSVSDQGRDNLGHTIPWTSELPTEQEQMVIGGGDFTLLKDLITAKRAFINSETRFVLPSTIVFTVEAAYTALDDPTLPNTYFHLMVAFQDGRKSVHIDCEPVFEALGMDFMGGEK